MSRYTARMPKLLLVAAVAVVLFPLPMLGGTAEIAAETGRIERDGDRMLQFWWLPPEYWSSAARELKRTKLEVDRAAELTRLYVIIAAIDGRLTSEGSFEFIEHRDMDPRIELIRDGKAVHPLHRAIDPQLAGVVADLTYFLKVSLGPLTQGLRIFLFPNVDDSGTQLLRADRRGLLEARYRLSGDGDRALDLRWPTPLTAIVGSTPCPSGGEPLEASWRWCPWHGVEVK